MENDFRLKVDLSSIYSYLKEKNVNLSEEESTKLNTIFKDADIYNENFQIQSDGKLNLMEIKSFLMFLDNALPAVKDKVVELVKKKYNEIFDSIANEKYVQKNDAIKNYQPYIQEEPIPKKCSNEEVKKQVKMAMADIKGAKFSDEDIDHWTDVIAKISQKANIPSVVVTAIVAKECQFKRNVKSQKGSGPMQVTSTTTQDMYSNVNGGRLDLYRKIDSELINDILYKKDEEGNLIQDANGRFVNNFKGFKELRDECSKDDELGVKVGIMCLKMKYVDAVRKIKKLSPNAAINGLKDGSIQLTKKEQLQAITTALKNYNSVLGNYAPQVVDSILNIGGQDAIYGLEIIPKKASE